MESILITGANRGIGLALARNFATSGCNVIATCRNPKKCTDLDDLKSSCSLTVHELEVTSTESVNRLCAELGNQPIDVLVNNAGIMGGDRQSMDDMDYEAWIEAFQVNTIAPFRLTNSLRGNLLKSQRPRVITLSSQMGSLNRKSKGSFAYRSSKAAVNKVMQVMSLELEADGIVVCPIHPGWVQTNMGGDTADISAQESSDGIVKLISSLTMEHSGRFWTWEGEEHPW